MSWLSGCAASFLLMNCHHLSSLCSHHLQIESYLCIKGMFCLFYYFLLYFRSFLRIWQPQEPQIACILPLHTHVSPWTRQYHMITSQTTALESAALADTDYPHRHLPGATNPAQIRNPATPSTLHNDIGANHHHTWISHRGIVSNTSGDRTSASISVWEGLQSAQPMMRTATLRTTRIMTRGPGGFILWGMALVLSCGVLTRKEVKDGGSRRAGDVEQDGGMKIGMPTANDSDDKHAILSIKGRHDGSRNVLGIKVVQCFTRPLLPTPPNTNISVPRSTHTPQPPQSHGSPLI